MYFILDNVWNYAHMYGDFVDQGLVQIMKLSWEYFWGGGGRGEIKEFPLVITLCKEI